MTLLKEGLKAPDFEGIDQNGKELKLSDFAGKKVVLYFYPKDNTSGCTAEACNILNDYGVWGEKKMYGKSYLGVIRTTFVIDEKGIIEKIVTKVETAGHAEQIINMYNQ